MPPLCASRNCWLLVIIPMLSIDQQVFYSMSIFYSSHAPLSWSLGLIPDVYTAAESNPLYESILLSLSSLSLSADCHSASWKKESKSSQCIGLLLMAVFRKISVSIAGTLWETRICGNLIVMRGICRFLGEELSIRNPRMTGVRLFRQDFFFAGLNGGQKYTWNSGFSLMSTLRLASTITQ